MKKLSATLAERKAEGRRTDQDLADLQTTIDNMPRQDRAEMNRAATSHLPYSSPQTTIPAIQDTATAEVRLDEAIQKAREERMKKTCGLCVVS